MNAYRVEVAGPAKRALRRLPTKVAAAIIEFIAGPLAENPQRLTKPLTGDLAGLRSGRRGDYRVLLQIHEDVKLILVVDIDHRAHIYRPRG